MCMTRLISACSRPWACWSPASESSRSRLFPKTLTNTRAWRRSGLVSTAVTVTKPMRGSLRPSAIRAERTSRRASFTLRMRSVATLLSQYVVRRSDTASEVHGLRKLPKHITLQVVHRLFQGTEVPPDERGRHGRALPEVVMVGLRDRCAEAALQLCLQGQKLLPLP